MLSKYNWKILNVQFIEKMLKLKFTMSIDKNIKWGLLLMVRVATISYKMNSRFHRISLFTCLYLLL